MLAWENSSFSIDASFRITVIDRDVPSYFLSVEHLLRYCARPPRKHAHRYHGVFAANHKLKRAMTALAIENIGKQVAAAPSLPSRQNVTEPGHILKGPAHQGAAAPQPENVEEVPMTELFLQLAHAGMLELVTLPFCGFTITYEHSDTSPGRSRSRLSGRTSTGIPA